MTLSLYIAMALLVWPVITGMLFQSVQSIWRAAERVQRRREHLGVSMMFGLLFASVWPFGLLMAWLITGFAEHGVWKLR